MLHARSSANQAVNGQRRLIPVKRVPFLSSTFLVREPGPLFWYFLSVPVHSAGQGGGEEATWIVALEPRQGLTHVQRGRTGRQHAPTVFCKSDD